jgi:nucleoside-diphosphate-sugar epimerase
MGKYKVLLTGITGFIGSHLALRLLKEGYEVHAVVRPGSKISELGPELVQKVHFYVTGPSGDLPRILGESNPDLVYHLASLYLSNHKYEDIPKLMESNVVFGTQLLDAMKIHHVSRLVNTGTSWQHYQNESYNPVNLYAASKQAFLSILRYYEETMRLQVMNLQLFDTYGPGDKRRKIMDLFQENIATREPLRMSPGEQCLDLMYVDDVIDALLLAGRYLLEEQYEYCGTYALSSGRLITLQDLAKLYEKVTEKPLHIVWGGRSYREREVMMPWQTGRALPGFRPAISLEEGIRRFALKMNK